MIIIDKALERRAAENRPILVGMVGAGFMGRGIALQIATAVPGMRLAAIANRNIEAARRAYEEAGHPEIREAGTPGALAARSEEHTSELQSLMRISYAVFCLKKKNQKGTPNKRI